MAVVIDEVSANIEPEPTSEPAEHEAENSSSSVTPLRDELCRWEQRQARLRAN